GELGVRRLPPGLVAQHLVSQRDRVVVEAQLGVLVDGPIVVVGGLGRVLDLEIEIADAIEDGEVGVRLPFPLLILEDFLPRLDGPLGVLGLEAASLVFLLLKLRHGALKIRTAWGGDKRNLLSTRRLRDSRPSSTPLRANLTPRTTPGPRAGQALSGPGPRPARAPPLR